MSGLWIFVIAVTVVALVLVVYCAKPAAAGSLDTWAVWKSSSPTTPLSCDVPPPQRHPELAYGEAPRCLRQSAIPPYVWTYWHDRRDMPVSVRQSIASWVYYNPALTVHVVDRTNLPVFLPDFDASALRHVRKRAHFSDQVRLALLWRYGGIWMDASFVTTRSLNWVFCSQAATQRPVILYYLARQTTRSDIPALENWFIAAAPRARFIKAWQQELMRANQFPTIDAYLQAIKAHGVDTQNIINLSYLFMHVAAQAVLQRRGGRRYRRDIYALRAEDGPFRYLAQNGYNTARVIACMHDPRVRNSPGIKLCRNEREYIDARAWPAALTVPPGDRDGTDGRAAT